MGRDGGAVVGPSAERLSGEEHRAHEVNRTLSDMYVMQVWGHQDGLTGFKELHLNSDSRIFSCTVCAICSSRRFQSSPFAFPSVSSLPLPPLPLPHQLLSC